MTQEIEVAGEIVTLLPERAMFWRAQSMLFIADLHLGKPDAFLQAGIPVPTRVTQRDLDRLCNVIETTDARRLVILGDFLHARASHSPGVFAALLAWRARCRELDILLVNGNHDHQAGPPPDELGIEICNEATVGPFYCVHIPFAEDEAFPAGYYGLGGHLHPYGVVNGKGRESVRLPCFYVGARQMVLPAFGHFTGGLTVHPAKNERIYVIAGDAVVSPRPAPARHMA